MPIIVNGNPIPPPYAPTLITPANAAYADLSGTPTFTWVYNPSQLGNTQTNWALRRKIAGAGSYQWWNLGTTSWQSGLVWNSGTGQSYTFPAASWTDGNVYNWSVANQDANGQGPCAPDDIVTAQAGPSVSVTAPGGTITTALPTVAWTPTIGAGASQTSWRVIIYNATQYGAGGFAPSVGPSVWDSGLIGDAFSTSVPVPVPLADGISFRAYVQLTETGGQTSSWGFIAFTTAYAQPVTPVFTAVAGIDGTTLAPLTTLTLTGGDNLLSLVNASFETGVGGWVNVANSSLATSVLQALDGTHSLQLTSIAAGDMSATTPTGTSGIAVTPAQVVTGRIASRAKTVARSTKAILNWYNAAGTFISASTGSVVANTTTGWTVASVTGTAPALSAFCAVVGYVVATGAAAEIHYIDEAGIFLGSSSTWGPGGLVGLTTANFTFSDDSGTTWWPVRGGTAVPIPAGTQQVIVIDYEAPLGFTRQYQAIVTATI